MNKKSFQICILSIILILFMGFNLNANSPSEPYNLITENLENRNFDRAYHWLNVTQQDFPNSKEAELAEWLKIPLYVGEGFTTNRILQGTMNGILISINALDSDKVSTYKELLDEYAEVSGLENFSFNSEKTIEVINNFLDDYEKGKIYDFNIGEFDSPDRLTVTDFKRLSEGRARRDTNIKEIENEMRHISVATLLLHFKTLQSSNNDEDRADLFYLLADMLKPHIVEKDDEEIEEMEEMTEEVEEDKFETTVIKLLDYSIEHAGDYSDTAMDAQEMKKEIEEM